MEPVDLRELLEQVQSGNLGIEEALHRLNKPAVADIGYAHVNLHRHDRCGFPEVIFCQGKSSEWIEGVVRKLIDAGQHCLATRVSDEQAADLADVVDLDDVRVLQPRHDLRLGQEPHRGLRAGVRAG